MTKIYSYAITALVAILIVGGGVWYMTYLRSKLDLALAKQLAAETSLDGCASALRQANDATAKAEQKAALMQSQAQSLIDSSDGQKAKNNAGGAVFAEKVTHSAKAPDCQAVLEAQLCPALSGY